MQEIKQNNQPCLETHSFWSPVKLPPSLSQVGHNEDVEFEPEAYARGMYHQELRSPISAELSADRFPSPSCRL